MGDYSLLKEADAVVVEAVPVASHEPARSNISRQRDVSLL